MHWHRPSLVIAMLLIGAQLLGPSTFWAMDRQNTVKMSPRRVIVAGLRGDVQATSADTAGAMKRLRFHDVVNDGDMLTTGPGSLVEVLVDEETLVTIHENSALQFLDGKPGTTAVYLKTGQVRLAVARVVAAAVTIHTPTATAVTWGGLVHITVIPGRRQASAPWHDAGSQAILTGRTPSASAREIPEQLEIFHGIEGTFQLKSSLPAGASQTVQAGQAVQVLAGQVGKPSAIPATSQGGHALPAVELHARTSGAGVRYLAEQQKLQAEALQRAMLKSLEMETSETTNAANSVIISTTGATLPSFQQPTQPVQTQPVPAPIIATTGATPSQLPPPPTSQQLPQARPLPPGLDSLLDRIPLTGRKQ